jgi:hypothetical protein
MSIGLFVVPHDIGLSGVIQSVFSSSAEQHSRAMLGVGLIFIGLLLGVVGSIMVASSKSLDREGTT